MGQRHLHAQAPKPKKDHVHPKRSETQRRLHAAKVQGRQELAHLQKQTTLAKTLYTRQPIAKQAFKHVRRSKSAKNKDTTDHSHQHIRKPQPLPIPVLRPQRRILHLHDKLHLRPHANRNLHHHPWNVGRLGLSTRPKPPLGTNSRPIQAENQAHNHRRIHSRNLLLPRLPNPQDTTRRSSQLSSRPLPDTGSVSSRVLLVHVRRRLGGPSHRGNYDQDPRKNHWCPQLHCFST